MDYESIIKKYEGKSIPHRGLCDDIKYIVMAIVNSLYKDDMKVNKVLCDSFSIYYFIKSISIDGNSCSIDFYDGDSIRNIKFGCYYFGDDYKEMCYTTDELIENGASDDKIKNLSGTYRFKGDCHNVSLYYLETFKNKNIRAVTSICNNIKGISFFHSYIWDCDTNLVYDIARNIVMDKDDFDYLFTLQEINCLSYDEFLIYNSSVPKDNYYDLLRLSVNTLSNNVENKVKKHM